MIIHCPQCGTGFRFDEHLLGSEGAWMRCGRCRRVFFHGASPGGESVTGVPADVGSRGERSGLHDAASAIDEIDHREYGIGISRGGEPRARDEGDGSGISSSPQEDNGKSSRALKWSLAALVIYLFFVVCVVGGVYLWLFSNLPAHIAEKFESISIPFFERTGEHGATDAVSVQKNADITFTGIEDSFASNWILGNLLVVKGTAVNNSDSPVSEIKVKGRVLNVAGEVLAVSESYCGNVLSDDGLSNMTAKEIEEELAKKEGSTVVNDAIPSGGTIPFMLVYINPAAGVDEISIELAGVKRLPGGPR